MNTQYNISKRDNGLMIDTNRQSKNDELLKNYLTVLQCSFYHI